MQNGQQEEGRGPRQLRGERQDVGLLSSLPCEASTQRREDGIDRHMGEANRERREGRQGAQRQRGSE
eukprot:711612-Pyramimonas_sp.AAC.1